MNTVDLHTNLAELIIFGIVLATLTFKHVFKELDKLHYKPKWKILQILIYDTYAKIE